MKLEIDMPEHHYNNILAFDSVSLGRVPYKGIIMYTINAIKHGKVLEQEPKTGHWITKPHVYGVTYCSECDFELKIDNTNYCPNCGVKMVEPQESEDAETHPINENITKGFEEFTKMMFRQGQAESEG